MMGRRYSKAKVLTMAKTQLEEQNSHIYRGNTRCTNGGRSDRCCDDSDGLGWDMIHNRTHFIHLDPII